MTYSTIKKGYTTNRLKVIYNKDLDIYKYYVNDIQVAIGSSLDFSNTSTAGCPGFYMGIGDKENEDFPYTPASCLFKFID
jgi:hypothetical protein